MTNDEINNLKGDALNAAVADAVGYEKVPSGPRGCDWYWSDGINTRHQNWSPATDWNDAMKLVEGMPMGMIFEKVRISVYRSFTADPLARGPFFDGPAVVARWFLMMKARKA